MRQMNASVLALALGLTAAMVLVSCGEGGGADLLPGETASEITANLNMIRDLADSGDCEGAQSAAQQVSDQIEALGGIDKRLKQALLDGAEKLNEVVASCVETTAPAIAPASIPETTESTVESPGKKEKKEKEKKPEEAEETETPPMAPTPAETTPTTPTTPAPVPTPPTGGGTGAPGGVSPGSAADGSQ